MTARLQLRGFAPTLLEKLFDDAPHVQNEPLILKRLSLEELKDSVARDLEALLNTRGGLGIDDARRYPESATSIHAYGMEDFVGLSLANPADCARICKTIESAIAAHEPRLRNPRVTLEADVRQKTTVRFIISALLVVRPMREPVNFDALLQPTTQQYSVVKTRHLIAPGQI